MIQVKVSMQGAPPGASFRPFSRSGSNEVDGVMFHINTQMDEADAWLVVEGPAIKREACRVPQGALIYLTAEPARPAGYLSEAPALPEFLSQFDQFFTCLDYVGEFGNISLPFLPWMIHANHGPSIFEQSNFGFSDLASLHDVPKTREISVICSTQASTPEHRMRLRFVEHLADRLGDRLDWFGNGRRTISAKWEGIAPYRYSIALENQSNRFSITEKIQDVFLALSFPIYWGASNASDFFEVDSFMAIDLRDFRGSAMAIEELLDEDPYENRMEAIRRSRDVVLNDLNMVHRMAAIAREAFEASRQNQSTARVVESVDSLISSSSRNRASVALARMGRGFTRASRRVLGES